MALILNIETATKNCSVSLALDGEIIGIKELNNGSYSHAEMLHVFIKEVIAEGEKLIDQLDAVAVSKGPGSYTGLRIGVSAAKGLCFALDVPLISLGTLEVLARQVDNVEGYIVPMLDARRMEVYSAVYDSNFNLSRNIEAQILEENSFDKYLKEKKVYFIGDGVPKTEELLFNSNAIFIQDKLPSAKEIAVLSYEKFQQKDFEDAAYFEPYYLKDFVVTPSKKK